MVFFVEFFNQNVKHIYISQYSHCFIQHNSQKKLNDFFSPHLDFEFNMITFFLIVFLTI